MTLFACVSSVILGSTSVFAQPEPLASGGWELRVYEVPSQRVLTTRRLIDGTEPFAVSAQGGVAISAYETVAFWDRKQGWRSAPQFGLIRHDGQWMYGESSAENSGSFSPDGKHVFFRIYPTMGSYDIEAAAVTVFRFSDMRRWIPEEMSRSAKWLGNNRIHIETIDFEEDSNGDLKEVLGRLTVTLPKTARAWVQAPGKFTGR